MIDKELDARLIAIESSLAVAEKVIDELNEVVIEQGKKIDVLVRQNRYLLSCLNDGAVKPQAEETPPPHY